MCCVWRKEMCKCKCRVYESQRGGGGVAGQACSCRCTQAMQILAVDGAGRAICLCLCHVDTTTPALNPIVAPTPPITCQVLTPSRPLKYQGGSRSMLSSSMDAGERSSTSFTCRTVSVCVLMCDVNTHRVTTITCGCGLDFHHSGCSELCSPVCLFPRFPLSPLHPSPPTQTLSLMPPSHPLSL